MLSPRGMTLPSSLFFSPPTEVIIGMQVRRSHLIDNNVLPPDKRASLPAERGFSFFLFFGAAGMIGMFLSMDPERWLVFNQVHARSSGSFRDDGMLKGALLDKWIFMMI